MPWYVVAYIVLLAAFLIYSIYDDVKSVRAWYVSIDAVVSLFWILAVFAYYDARLAPPVPVGVALLVAALLWTAWDVHRELQELAKQSREDYDPDLSAEANLWIDRGIEVAGIAIAAMMLAPAIVFAVRVLKRG